MQLGKEISPGYRAKMEALERSIREELEPVECEVRHHFADAPVRAKIFSLQNALFAAIEAGELEPYDCEANLQHHFAPGAYGRTLFFPKGTYIVGKIHKHSHLNILSQGEVIVVTESGGMERLKGPMTMVSPPGTKRALYALEDTTWTTIHLTSETDLAKIEAHVIAPTYEDYEAFRQDQKPLEAMP